VQCSAVQCSAVQWPDPAASWLPVAVGTVNKIGDDHIGLLVFGVFNAVIGAAHIRPDFKCSMQVGAAPPRLPPAVALGAARSQHRQGGGRCWSFAGSLCPTQKGGGAPWCAASSVQPAARPPARRCPLQDELWRSSSDPSHIITLGSDVQFRVET
jgi:hypothetical protein